MQETERTEKRNITIDLLRVIGLFLVIAAHCEFPEWFYEFREFDVVTLVAVSGMSFYVSSNRKAESYPEYVKKRFLRLVLPVWEFLIVFFLVFALLGVTFRFREILESFLLLSGGILFIWVYRIFFVNALLNPFLKQAADRCSIRNSALLLAGGLIVNEGLFRVSSSLLTGTAGKVFEYVVLYTLGYALVSFAGMLWMKATSAERYWLTAEAGILLAASLLLGGIARISETKYPPQLVYLSYGLLMTFVLYLILQRLPQNEKAGQIITWLSVNTMHIYMWHIFLYYLLKTLSPLVMNHAWPTYAVLLGGSIVLTFLQENLISLKRKR